MATEQDPGPDSAQMSQRSRGCEGSQGVALSQLNGGMWGCERECKPAGDSIAHFFYKRAKRLAGTAGTAAEHRERIAALTIG
jgi:hypothetical protein